MRIALTEGGFRSLLRRHHLVPAVLVPLLISACAGSDEEPVFRKDNQPISGMTLEALALDIPVIRGFVADGTGCATLGEPVIQGNTVTFILTDYLAAKEGMGIARATCDVAVEIDLPAGVTISLDSTTYRGFADGFDARSAFFREYFFDDVFTGDRRFTVLDHSLGPPIVIRNDSDAYMIEFGEFTALDSVFSTGIMPCGELLTWRANTSLSVRNNSSFSFSLAAFDTIDIVNQYFITFDFGRFVACN